MNPSDFPDSNQTWVIASRPEADLPVQNDGFQLTSLWRLSRRERISALLFGRVWLGVQGQNQPPVWLECTRDIHDVRSPLRRFRSRLRRMLRKA